MDAESDRRGVRREAVIAPYDPDWPRAFEDERGRLAAALGSLARRIEHNGSTAVPGLAAKPIIDIQISVAQLRPVGAYGEPLAALGYTHVAHPDDDRCPFFHRPAAWPHTHHVHVVESGAEEERRALAFRDYLRDHDRLAREYEQLKRSLAERFDLIDVGAREDYAQSKTEFVERVLARAFAEGY
jgi:GrpB-like predicted nucleotidyltransferase (UPF0157 family)